MTATLSREAVARLGVRFSPPVVQAETPPRARDCANWMIQCLATFGRREDITAEAVAERSGQPLAKCKQTLVIAAGAKRIRRVNTSGGRPVAIWERTTPPWNHPGQVRGWGKIMQSIARMKPGKRFIRAELASSNASTNRAMSRAIAAGIVVQVARQEPPRAIYRRIV